MMIEKVSIDLAADNVKQWKEKQTSNEPSKHLSLHTAEEDETFETGSSFKQGTRDAR